MTSYETLLCEIDEGVATVTLNRPEVLNAFNPQMEAELAALWQALQKDDDVRCIVLTGAGDRAFCVGIDRDATIGAADATDGHLGYSTPWVFDDPGQRVGPKANHLWKPVIGAVRGMACGGAFYILGETDFIIAGRSATFFDPHVTFQMPAAYEPIHLLQKMPMQEVLRMSLLGAHERMSAQRAYEVGLVSEVVDDDEVLDGGPVGGRGHRIGASPGHPGDAAGDLDGRRGAPRPGVGAVLALHPDRDRSRGHAGGPGRVRHEEADRVADQVGGRARPQSHRSQSAGLTRRSTSP